MWRFRYLPMALLAALALQSFLQGQQCSSGGDLEASHRGWPYTARYHEKQRPELERVIIVAMDSHGRFLTSYTSADGSGTSIVNDPVAEQEVHWDTSTKKVKIVKYSTPLEGRRSCWQSAWSHRFCSPAGEVQGAFCRDACYIERLAKALPPEKNGFLKCNAPQGGTAEDLGTSVILGIPAHGCRTTYPSAFGDANLITEAWSDEYGLNLRSTTEDPSGKYARYFREIISLSRDEPDVSAFQPPSGYAVVMQDAEQVPCKPPSVIEIRK